MLNYDERHCIAYTSATDAQNKSTITKSIYLQPA